MPFDAERSRAPSPGARATPVAPEPDPVSARSAFPFFARSGGDADGAAGTSPPTAPSETQSERVSPSSAGAIPDVVAFMSQLRADVTAVCDAELASAGRTAQGCPYLTHWLRYYEGRTAAQVERAIRAYTGTVARDPAALLVAVVSRVRAAVRTWVATGRPPDASGLGSLSETIASASGGASSGIDPGAVRAELRGGANLDAGTRSHMERAFGRGFAGVRVHTDATAARLSSRFGAKAFTVGQDVAFAAGAYRPGSLAGDLLIAHELAHTIQQGGQGAVPASEVHDGSLEDNADVTAVGAVAAAHGMALPPGFAPAVTLSSGTGLRFQGCQEHKEAPPPAAVGLVPDYNLISNPDGTIATDAQIVALYALFENPDQLDRLYDDAAKGNARARKIVEQTEQSWREIAVHIAVETHSASCVVPPFQVVRILSGGESCVPDWSRLDFLARDRPGGIRLREVIAEAYSKKARELGIRNDIIVAGLNLLLAGWAAKSGLSAEVRALGVEAGPKPPPRPKPVEIPQEIKGLSGTEAAQALNLPTPPAGYRWLKTGAGKLTVARMPGTARAGAPRLRYDPATKTFPEESKFARPRRDIVKPSVPPEELEDSATQAAAARDSLKDIPPPKTKARAEDGTERQSGWGSDIKSLDPVADLSKKCGHTPEPNPALDKAGYPGSYNLSHAEKQAAAAAAKGSRWFGVSKPMCLDCQAFFKKLAAYWDDPIVVADPAGIRIFYPDGTVLSASTAALVGAAAAKKEESEP